MVKEFWSECPLGPIAAAMHRLDPDREGSYATFSCPWGECGQPIVVKGTHITVPPGCKCRREGFIHAEITRGGVELSGDDGDRRAVIRNLR